MVEVNSISDAPVAKPFQFVGGELCLDFCNTVGGKRGAIARERLKSYDDFLSWSNQAGLLDKNEAESLRRQSTRRPAQARTVLRRAIDLREAIYLILFQVMQNKSPHAADLAQLNVELARVLNRLQVARSGEGFAWRWIGEAETLDYPLGPITRSAADLLMSSERLGHVSRCEGDNCGWLFIDSSKNQSRRWCDMRDCGNRAKVRRHRLKHRRRKHVH